MYKHQVCNISVSVAIHKHPKMNICESRPAVLILICLGKGSSSCSISMNVQDQIIYNSFLCHGKSSRFVLIIRSYSNRKL